jgi:hypothetical protein
MAWWVLLIIYAATTVLSGLLQRAPNQKASSLGDLQVPTAEEGRSLPVVWGTCCLKSPNVVWYGDYKVKAIRKSMGIMAFGRTYVAGHRYYLGLDMGLCHGPVDELVSIMAGSGENLKALNFTVTGTNADGSKAILANDKKCFGGDDSEGGIYGVGTFYQGSATQQSNSYMSSMLGITYPAYRGISHIVCNQWYLGSSQYIKNLAFVFRRCPSNLGLSSAQTNINGDANPAEMIYECLNVQAWALGFPIPNFNIESFKTAGATLAAEGLGMSLQLDSPKQADQIIEMILQHIDGVCYTDPSTGLWTLKLVRPDYDPEDLPEFGPDDVAECEYSRGSWEDTLNEVKVKYVDRDTWKQAQVQAQDGANFKIRSGELASKTIDFSGFSSAEIAQKACNRDLRTLSYPIGKGRVKINRKAWALRMGSAFRLTWPPLGISDMCVRVTSINYGTLTDGMIEAEICEDVFSADYTCFSAPASGGWSDPCRVDPEAPAAQLVMEAPYQMLDGAAVPRVLVGAVAGDSVSLGYQIWTDEGSGYKKTNDTPVFCPSGLLQSAYSRITDALDTTGFTLISGLDLDELESTDAGGRDRGENLLLFADTGELCAWQSVTDNGDGSFTFSGIVRGVYDTLPEDHAQGARVYVIHAGNFDSLADYRADTLSDSGDDSVILND